MNALTFCILETGQGQPIGDETGAYITIGDCSNPRADQIADSIDRNGSFILQGVTRQERLDRMFGILFGTTFVTTIDQAFLLGISIRGSLPAYYRP